MGGASKIIDAEGEGTNNLEEVSIVAIDEEVPGDRNVSILQLDVEGFEMQALSGALQTIRRCTPILILENLDDSDLFESEWFAKNILSLGYRRTGNLHGNACSNAERIANKVSL